jgi:hypothetical protein
MLAFAFVRHVQPPLGPGVWSASVVFQTVSVDNVKTPLLSSSGGVSCSTKQVTVEVQSLVSCAALRLQGSPKERPQTEDRLDMWGQGEWVLLATRLCPRVLLEKCRSIVSRRVAHLFWTEEVRSQEVPNMN